jgi:macrolide phosphotransferase
MQLEDLARVLPAAFPDLHPVAPIAVLGKGFRSFVVETPARVVIRVGLSQEALDGYALERRVLPFLRGYLDTPIPETGSFAAPREGLPFGAHAYPKLDGVGPAFGIDAPEGLKLLARDLGAFMAQLHAIPVAQARPAGIPEVDSRTRLIGARDVVVPVLEERLNTGEFERVLAWWEVFATDPRMQCNRWAVCHHDMWHDNLLMDADGNLSGVLDWSHVEIGDPAHDFSAPRYFGGKFMTHLHDAYVEAGGRFDDESVYRAQRFWEGREIGGIAWAIEHNDAEELAAGIEKLRRGPLLSD